MKSEKTIETNGRVCARCKKRKEANLFMHSTVKGKTYYAYTCRRCYYDQSKKLGVNTYAYRKKSLNKNKNKNLLKTRARDAVRTALESGVLVKKPCIFCHSSKTVAHHPDYRKKLLVLWLCASCHHRFHWVLNNYYHV